MLPTGALNADRLWMVPETQRFIRRIEDSGKPIATICHAPWFLVSAGLVGGRKLTSRSPRDLPAFNRAMIELFSGHVGRSHVAA